MKRYTFLFILFFSTQWSNGQAAYPDSLNTFREKYITTHEVITGDDRKRLRFYPVNESYKVLARFEATNDSKWFNMETSGTIKKIFRVYGILHFRINDTALNLQIYQSQNLMNLEELRDYLFLPFTDLTSGEGTYTAGRYIDLAISDVVNNTITIDFNKAYNPYCAYVNGKYNCPIPPRENDLPVAILAGEQTYLKAH